jgi:TrmH family RNA methyltransferase
MSDIVSTFQRARRDPELVLLEGFHALKHAIRVHAEISQAICTDLDAVRALADQFAPDVAEQMLKLLTESSQVEYKRMGDNLPRVEILAIARRPQIDGMAFLAGSGSCPIVLLEDPHNLGNLGAVIRASAAAGADAVITTGDNDPWNPMAVRGSAGLHFALPVARIENVPQTSRLLVALDPQGEPLGEANIPEDAILVFGTERHGLSNQMLERADLRVRIPMQPGVSSLNLATSVAIMLYRG